MPTRKIGDLPAETTCRHPEHDPPNMMVYQPGIWEHECPGCHRKFTFTVYPSSMCSTGDSREVRCWDSTAAPQTSGVRDWIDPNAGGKVSG